MDKPLISVILPIYNVEKYLNRCLNSVVSQTYQNLEIILVDDGSSDGCPTLCEEWARKDNRIRVIHKENQGLGMARNTGIEFSTGMYICYFDSDDYIAANTIELAYNAMQLHNADYAIFGNSKVFQDGSESSFNSGSCKTLYEGDEVTTELLPWLIQYNRKKEPKCTYAFSAWSGLLRKEILDRNHIRFQSERQVVSEDTLYLLELFSKLSVVVLIPRPLYFYCMNPSSLTKTYKKDRQRKNNVFLRLAHEAVLEQRYSKEIQTRVDMLYQAFTLEAMKHVIRMQTTYREKRLLLAEFFFDENISNTITWNTLIRSGFFMAVFMLCLKLRLQLPCFIMLWIREKKSYI